ncbi:uncharacterized protein GGS22DRAFT_186135 [Annulohypoxylon maeteangense]|uniref:uncharacterized protein n=1 Tax=Annulohypoxylon maeteangense TaxID=1927788 RepID=UPI002008146B|nr:uncharacterized protein GGS22DRAFT_186135 [Annulohypoxylon maeteangense]KAI0887301.1 hypothetical protein GGS22DRAFT_186135 [Annulohypoxylon maeteangense]
MCDSSQGKWDKADKTLQALPVLIDQHNIHKHLQSLQEIAHANNGSRMAGSHGHNQTIEYIRNELDSLGYYVEVQKFEGIMPVNDHATLVVNGNRLHAEPVGWSPSAALTDRPLVIIGEDGCYDYDYPIETIGAIVVVNGEGCSFSVKSLAAQSCGADAILIHEDTQLTPSLGGHNSLHLPSARISEKAFNDILDQPHPLWVDFVRISTKTEWECGDDENTLMVGTHTDSVGKSAGINDNASGIASLLEVAARLTKFKTGSRVKFAFWTAAEPCLLGSKHFVSSAYPEELRKIRLYLDVNMLGSSNGALKVYSEDYSSGTSSPHHAPFGSLDATFALQDGFGVQGAQSIGITRISNRSDYAPFFNAGIPFAGLFSGANGLKTREEAQLYGGRAGHPYDGHYHQPEDNITYINMTTLLLNTKALAHTVGTYGRSLKEFPTQAIDSAAWRHATPAKYSTLIAHAWMAYGFLLHAL